MQIRKIFLYGFITGAITASIIFFFILSDFKSKKVEEAVKLTKQERLYVFWEADNIAYAMDDQFSCQKDRRAFRSFRTILQDSSQFYREELEKLRDPK